MAEDTSYQRKKALLALCILSEPPVGEISSAQSVNTEPVKKPLLLNVVYVPIRKQAQEHSVAKA